MTRASGAFVGSSAVLLLVLGAGHPAWAQASPQNAKETIRTAPPSSSHWQLTFRFGGGSTGTPTSGVSSIPPPGLPINLGPDFSTRHVPSWFFGDGAVLLNQHAIGGKTITSLDPVLGAAATSRSSGAAFGVTASQRLSPRLRLDFSLDAAHTAPTFSPASRATIEAARSSFADAFGGILQSNIAPFTGVSVSSTTSVTNGGGFEWMATAGVEIILSARGRTTWYSTVGAGMMGDTGDRPTATLTGHYAFNLGLAPYDQTDAIVVHAAQTRHRWTGIVGGGWTRDLNARWALDASLRVGISQSGLTTRVDAAPTSVLVDANRAFAIGLGPGTALIFDNFALTSGSLSSLRGSLTGVRTFITTGPQFHVLVSAGLVMRF